MEQLKTQLPDYMVPTHLILLGSMPLTAKGSVFASPIFLP